MTVTVYRSTDSSAPVLTNTAGAMITVLDAILVNGYGSKAAAGWTKAYSGTNKAAYRGASGTQFYLRVDDADTTNSRIVGYETMSDVDTGTNPFPTAAQVSGGLYWLRAANVAWVCIADGKGFYLVVNTNNGTGGGNGGVYHFGDFTSYKSGDAYNCMIMGGINTTRVVGAYRDMYVSPTVDRTADLGHFIARGVNGVAGAVTTAKCANGLMLGCCATGVTTTNLMGCNRDSAGGDLSATAASKSVEYPNAADGSVLMTRIYLSDGTVGLRGYLRGYYTHGVRLGTPMSHGDTFTGSGAISTKSFEVFGVGDSTNSNTAAAPRGRVIIETSDTW